MKTLLVMRHAKSDWGATFSSDRERPLSRRGINAARRVGRFLSDAGTTPDLVLSSTAVRALTTAELAADAGDWDCEILTSENLYASDPETVLGEVHGVDNGVERLLIAGHEPTWSTLVTWLIGGGRVRMPTAAVACLDLPHGEWTDLAPATCVLRWFVIPRALN
ncbi:MAG: histidine phosphatase family protein [Acidobacteria bacterium]|nr:histidine phosphatase family protein [Acidobacteriota bacterium]